MAGIYGRINGAKLLQSAIKKLDQKMIETAVEAVRESTLLVHETAVKLLQDNTDGTPTTRYNPKRTVFTSKPGDPPNTDRGQLVRSTKFDFKNKGLTGRVGSNLKYAKILEFGDKRTEARPWLSLAVLLSKLAIGKSFKKAFDQTIKKVRK